MYTYICIYIYIYLYIGVPLKKWVCAWAQIVLMCVHGEFLYVCVYTSSAVTRRRPCNILL